MEGWPLDEQRSQSIWRHCGDARGVELGAEALAKQPRSGECLLERYLLVEDKAN
jgi:hypothetical protein